MCKVCRPIVGSRYCITCIFRVPKASSALSTYLKHNGLGDILDPHVWLGLPAVGDLVVLGLLSKGHKVWVQLLPHRLELCICHTIAHPVANHTTDATQHGY